MLIPDYLPQVFKIVKCFVYLAVSYTHLDVYKRKLYACPHRWAAAWAAASALPRLSLIHI